MVACPPCFDLLDEVINELLLWLGILVAFGKQAVKLLVVCHISS